MTKEHWFDRLNRLLVMPALRRQLWCSGAALIGLGAAPLSLDAAGRNQSAGKGRRQQKRAGKGKNKGTGKGKPKGKGKGKGKSRPQSTVPAGTCSGGACAAYWPSDTHNRNHCEFICRQCDGDDTRQFCIVEGDPLDSTKVAVCCEPDAICCGESCCLESQLGMKCCPPEGCVNTVTNPRHCGNCFRSCAGGDVCENGECIHYDDCEAGSPCGDACVDLMTDPIHCGSCNHACADGEDCVLGTCVENPCGDDRLLCPPHGCVDTDANPYNCGSCGNRCMTGMQTWCVDGQCSCQPGTDLVPCGDNCIPRTFTCCGAGASAYGCSNQCGLNGGCA
jgi:hypothetical protein